MNNLNAKRLSTFALILSVFCVTAAFADKPTGNPGAGGSDIGVVTINQDKAAAGGVTNGDAPGFPVTLSKSGSYRLEGNLTVPNTATTAIQITADDVTLDMNGFVISGPNVCTNGGVCDVIGGSAGIESTAEHTTVFGGTVRGMGGSGLYLGPHAQVERVRAKNNGATGIVVLHESLVTDSTAEFNYYYGIWADIGSLVFRNRMSSNLYGAHFSPFPGRVASGLNFFINNVVAPIDGDPSAVQPNSCYGPGC